MIRRFAKTDTEAINELFDPGGAIQLEEITLHLSATGGDQKDMTIDIVYKDGPVYTWRVATVAMNAVKDYQYLPTRPLELWAGDKILVKYDNDLKRTWGLVIKCK